MGPLMLHSEDHCFDGEASSPFASRQLASSDIPVSDSFPLFFADFIF